MIKREFMVALFCGIILTGCFPSDKSNDISSKNILSSVTNDSKAIDENKKIGLNNNSELYNPIGDKIIYIDPENENDDNENGSSAHPYNSFTDVTWADNTIYALKRGTTLIMNESIIISADDIIICSYGTSKEKPIIHSTLKSTLNYNEEKKLLNISGGHVIVTNYNGVNNVIIRDLNIKAENSEADAINETYNAFSCVYFNGKDDNVKLINCKLHGGVMGFRSTGTNTNISIENCEIYDIYEDGVFIQNTTGIEIANCYIHDVNLAWDDYGTDESRAGGDAIQFYNCDNWHIHHNYIDRLNRGGKFSFITTAETTISDGIFEHNIIKGPEFNGSALYLSNAEKIIVRYNYLTGTDNQVGNLGEKSIRPVYCHAKDLQFYGNVIRNYDLALFCSNYSGQPNIYNNTFYNMIYSLKSGDNISLNLNNNIIYSENGTVLNYCPTEPHGSNNAGKFSGLGNSIENTISANPLFVDAENKDFHLKSTTSIKSPCIDSGIDMGLSYDYDGIAIPQGKSPDIGAFEYH